MEDGGWLRNLLAGMGGMVGVWWGDWEVAGGACREEVDMGRKAREMLSERSREGDEEGDLAGNTATSRLFLQAVSLLCGALMRSCLSCCFCCCCFCCCCFCCCCCECRQKKVWCSTQPFHKFLHDL